MRLAFAGFATKEDARQHCCIYEADKKSESCCDMLAAANQNKKDEGVVLRTMPMPSFGNEAWACKICYNRWWKSLNAEKPAARKSRAATAQAAVPPPPAAATTATTATATGVMAIATTATATGVAEPTATVPPPPGSHAPPPPPPPPGSQPPPPWVKSHPQHNLFWREDRALPRPLPDQPSPPAKAEAEAEAELAKAASAEAASAEHARLLAQLEVCEQQMADAMADAVAMKAAAVTAEAAKDEAVAKSKVAAKEAADAAEEAAALRQQVSQLRAEAEAARDVGGVRSLLVALGGLSVDDLDRLLRHGPRM